MFLDIADSSMIGPSTSIKPIFSVPSERDRQFVGREDILLLIFSRDLENIETIQMECSPSRKNLNDTRY